LDCAKLLRNLGTRIFSVAPHPTHQNFSITTFS
jgi:hypothetical protein